MILFKILFAITFLYFWSYVLHEIILDKIECGWFGFTTALLWFIFMGIFITFIFL